MAAEERFAELWTDYLEGDLDAAGHVELQELLDADASKRQMAVDLFQTHRLLGFALQNGGNEEDEFVRSTMAALPRTDREFVASVMTHIPATRPARRTTARMMAGAACGLLVGILATSAAWVFAIQRSTARSNDVVVLLDEGFESGVVPSPTGFPTAPEHWSGDFCEIVGERQQVKPSGGGRMLRFLRADYEGKPGAEKSYVSDLYYLLDVRAHRARFEDGGAVVQLSASFNASPFAEDEKYQSSISLFALDAETVAGGSIRNDNGLQTDSLSFLRASRLMLDRDPATWQRLTGELRLPVNTEYLLVRIAVGHATTGQRRIDFPGQYVDDVRLVLARRSPLP